MLFICFHTSTGYFGHRKKSGTKYLREHTKNNLETSHNSHQTLPNHVQIVKRCWLLLIYVFPLLPNPKGFLDVSVVKDLPANAGDTGDVGLIPRSGRSPGGGIKTRSSILTWRILWTEEPGWLQSMGSQRVGHYLASNINNNPVPKLWIFQEYTVECAERCWNLRRE